VHVSAAFSIVCVCACDRVCLLPRDTSAAYWRGGGQPGSTMRARNDGRGCCCRGAVRECCALRLGCVAALAVLRPLALCCTVRRCVQGWKDLSRSSAAALRAHALRWRETRPLADALRSWRVCTVVGKRGDRHQLNRVFRKWLHGHRAQRDRAVQLHTRCVRQLPARVCCSSRTRLRNGWGRCINRRVEVRAVRRWQLYTRCKSLQGRLSEAAVAHYRASVLSKCFLSWRNRAAYASDVVQYTRCAGMHSPPPPSRACSCTHVT
jgi:hypothetical protein